MLNTRGNCGIPQTEWWGQEYWRVYRGPSLPGVEWFGSSPTPHPPLPSATCLPMCLLVELTEKKGVGRGAKSNDLEKSWPSIILSILSGWGGKIRMERGGGVRGKGWGEGGRTECEKFSKLLSEKSIQERNKIVGIDSLKWILWFNLSAVKTESQGLFV
jgi:hypothetical protein